MAQFIASTSEIEELLMRLHDLVQSGGGMVHEAARLCEREGAFTIEAPATVGARQPLIEVPGNLLLPPAWFGLSLAGDELQIGTVDDRASPLQSELMETLVALYNATGKVKHHRATSTYSIYRTDFELFSKIAFPEQIRARETEPGEDGLLRDFLRTRVLAVPQSVLGNVEEGAASQPIDVLMPIIDFLNHHPRAGGYNMLGGKLVAVRGHPVDGNDECFICYARHDAQSLLFTYGYLHRGLPFAFSTPMTLKVETVEAAKGTLAIFRSGAGMRAANIPAAFRDDGWILPAVSGNASENLIQLGYLPISPAIPQLGEGPVPLTRRFLDFVVSAFLGEGAPASDIARESARLEREILAANIEHYEALKQILATRDRAPEAALAFDTVASMIDMQLGILKTYSATHIRMET